MENLDKQPVNRMENSKLAAWMPDLSMYEISGQDTITEHGLARYLKDKEQDGMIKALADNPTVSLWEKIDKATPTEKITLIMLALENPDIETEKEAAMNMYQLSEEQQAPLREIVSEKISIGLRSQDAKVRKNAAEMIYLAPKKDIAPLIRLSLTELDPGVRKAAARLIYRVSDDEIASLIKSALDNPDPEVGKIAAKMFNLAPAEEKSSLKKVLSVTIKTNLKNPNIETRKASMSMIYWAPDEEKIDMIRMGLEDEDLEVQSEAAKNTGWLKDEEKIPLSRMISQKIKQGLDDLDTEIRKKSVALFDWAADEDKAELFNLIKAKGLGAELAKPSLYGNKNINQAVFSRQHFDKTGSGTTLLGGRLEDKTIIRHIKPKSFLAWQKLYEDQAIWKETGFDYVPIEPIQSYRLDDEGLVLVDVFSGVLDLNLADWLNKTKSFMKDENKALLEQRDRILRVLGKSGVRHGHTHAWNFCLRFFRDDKGVVDLDRVPRLYLIDFDEAVLTANPEK